LRFVAANIDSGVTVNAEPGADRSIDAAQPAPDWRGALTIEAVRETLRVIISRTSLSARRASIRAGFGMALVLCVGATLVAASSFRQPGVAAPSRATSSDYASLASSAATPGAAGTLKPTTERWHPLPADTAAATPSPTTACAPGFDSECYAPQPPTPAPALVPTSGPAFTLRVPILEYHRIKPPAGESGSTASLIVAPEIFTAQMDALSAAGWRTITMGDLGDSLRLGLQPPSKTFVITFDDGYEDGFQYAFPILRSHGFVATFFVIAGKIGETWQLSPAHMRELVAAGNEIGNHSMSHTNMMVMTPERLIVETYGASAIIADHVGIWPKSFSYPMGLTYAPSSAAVAATPGILTAVIQGGSKRETWANRLEIPRIRVGPGTYPPNLVERLSRYVS
jgi:peptidoglycan/xylan/chitin deacetylase (PgdA/CDA1 family)